MLASSPRTSPTVTEPPLASAFATPPGAGIRLPARRFVRRGTRRTSGPHLFRDDERADIGRRKDDRVHRWRRGLAVGDAVADRPVERGVEGAGHVDPVARWARKGLGVLDDHGLLVGLSRDDGLRLRTASCIPRGRLALRLRAVQARTADLVPLAGMPLAAAGACPRDALVALIALGSLGLLIFIFVFVLIFGALRRGRADPNERQRAGDRRPGRATQDGAAGDPVRHGSHEVVEVAIVHGDASHSPQSRPGDGRRVLTEVQKTCHREGRERLLHGVIDDRRSSWVDARPRSVLRSV